MVNERKVEYIVVIFVHVEAQRGPPECLTCYVIKPWQVVLNICIFEILLEFDLTIFHVPRKVRNKNPLSKNVVDTLLHFTFIGL